MSSGSGNDASRADREDDPQPRHWFLKPAVVAAWAPVMAALITALALLLVNARPQDRTDLGPTPPPTSATSPPTSAPVPVGEVWEWALGRNLTTDTALAAYRDRLTSDGRVPVQSKGFSLQVDGSGDVVAVTLFNDETALGFPGLESNYSTYKGRLPDGNAWSDTATSIAARYRITDFSGGFGIELTTTHASSVGRYHLEFGFMARYQRELVDSPLHWISVRPS